MCTGNPLLHHPGGSGEVHMKQTDLFDEIIVDNFAGGGGASTGIELAAGRPVAIAINHDPDAILLHKTNHPYTEHLQASVWDVDPVQVVRGRHVGLAKADGRNLGHWPEIRDLLNRYCGYALSEDDVILLLIGGVYYYISDITLRMLTPRELYNAMGFPPDYIIDRDYMGNAYGKTKQVARCGNAVCPPLAEAMVRANLPEWCGEKIRTMEKLCEAVTA